MIFLCIDTSTSHGSLALVQWQQQAQAKVITTKEWERKTPVQGSHAEIVIPAIAELLQQASLRLRDINVICCGRGPGSFTGIRVAINAAKSLAYALQKPVIGIDSLRLMAEPALNGGLPVLSMIYGFRDLAYVACYEKHPDGIRNTMAPAAVTSAKLEVLIAKPHLTVGSGFDALAEKMSPSLRGLLRRDSSFSDWPKAEHLPSIAYYEGLDLKDQCKDLHWKNLLPLYLRASEAEEKLKRGLLKPLPQWKL